MEKLIWHNERRKVDELLPYKSNPRLMTQAQADQLRTSLERFDLVEVPAINTDNTIVAGHMRLKMMQLLERGQEEIDVRVPSRPLTEEEVREYNLRSNKNTGEWEWELLASIGEEQLLEVGFTEDELLVGFGLLEAAGADVDPLAFGIVTVFPPEAPKLKEMAQIHIEPKEQYDRVKAWIENNTEEAARKLIDAANV